jgi:hypothetical protein
MSDLAAPPRRLPVRAWSAVRPTYEALFGGPFREGRIRLAGLDAPTWVLAAVGIVALAALSVSVLFADSFRAGRLVDLGTTGGRTDFLPAAMLPVTLVAMGLAWTLILSGACRASWPVRVGAAFAFLVINAAISKPAALSVRRSAALEIGPTLASVAYYVVPGIVLLSLILDRIRPTRRVTPTAIPALLAAGLLAFFGALLWVHTGNEEVDLVVYVPTFVDGAIIELQGLLVPMVMVGGLGVVGFAHAVAGAASTPAWAARRTVALGLLAGLLAVKLWIQLGRHLGERLDAIGQAPVRAAFTLALLALLVAGARALRRWLGPSRPEVEAVQERLLFAAALLLALPGLVSMLVLAVQQFIVTQLDWISAAKLLLRFPFSGWLLVADVLIWIAALVAGVLLVRARDRPVRRELGGALALVAGWELCFAVPSLLERFPGFDDVLFDVALTVAVAGYAAARWRRLDAAAAVRLAAFVAFAWLVSTKGDWLGIVASIFGFPAIAVVLIGLWFTILAGSAFTSVEGARIPRASRPLIWIGYLVLSMTLLQWFQSSHSIDPTAEAGARAFIELGIPLAAWLLVRRPFEPPAAVVAGSADGAIPSERADRRRAP